MEEPFPWRNHTKDVLRKDYLALQKRIQKETPVFPVQYRYVGIKVSNHFFQYERMKTPSQGKICGYDFWFKHKDKIKKYNSKKTSGDLFGAIVFMNHAPSQFLPFVAAMFYKYFEATRIFDPYAGWGDRCLAAMAMDVDYVGVDSNPNLVTPFQKMIDFIQPTTNVQFISSKAENVNINNLEFDFVFSSPPFWSEKQMLEKYTNTETDFEVFMSTSLIPVVKACLEKQVPVCLYINEKMYDKLAEAVGQCLQVFEFTSTSNQKKNWKTKFNKVYQW